MVDVNTIIGNPVTSIDGTIIIPISKATFGFVTGGTDFTLVYSATDSPEHPFGGGTGAGVTLRPVSFLIVKEDSVRLLNVETDNPYEKLAEAIPDVVDAIKDMLRPENTTEEYEVTHTTTHNS